MGTPPYFYNYYNYDTVNYPLIRLYGVWSNNQGSLQVTLNNTLLPYQWRYKNATFKVFVKLSVGQNDIILRDVNGLAKQITIYYDIPNFDSNKPILKLVLYDAYDGTGTCDAPPSRTDNTLADNINRVKTDGLLLQSFFAEAYRAARQKQEGLVGLPFTTFNLELDANNEPVVHYLKATNPVYTKSYYWSGPVAFTGIDGIDAVLPSIKPAGKTVYTIGYSLTSHLDHATQKYGGWLGQSTPLFGGINSGNLIWHAKDIYGLQNIFDDNTLIDLTYNIEDAAKTVTESYSRILGSLLHEMLHHCFNMNHPDEIINIVNKTVNPRSINYNGTIVHANAISYIFPFDFEEYPSGFGIDMNDATNFRLWFMPYALDNSLIPYNKSEYGPNELGWFSPYAIQGYVNTYQAIKDGQTVSQELKALYDVNKNVTIDKKIWEGMPMYGFVNSPLLYYHPKYEYPQNNWRTFNKGNYVIRSPNTHTICIAYIWGSGGGEYAFAGGADINYYNTRDPDLRNIVNPMTHHGGAGGFIKVTFPIYSNSELKIVVGDRNGNYGGGGAPYVQNGSAYGGYGGGKSAIYMNNIPIGIAGGGGSGSVFSPGQTVGQVVQYTPSDGKSGFIVTGSGDSYLLDQSSGGGAGYYGGTSGAPDITLDGVRVFGSGAGSSYVSGLCTKSITKPGIPVTAFKTANAFKSILPSLFISPPENIGSTFGDGCIMLNFVHVSPSRWNAYYQNYGLVELTATDLSTNDTLETNVISIIPRVKQITNISSFITLSQNNTAIISNILGTASANENTYLNEHINVLTKELTKICGIIPTNTVSPETTIQLVLDKNDSTLQNGGNEFYKYSILIQDISPQIIVTGGTIAGIAHGTATILQQIRTNSPGEARLTKCSINDSSVAEYTSILIDPARDPLEYDYMCELVDLCRFYKIRCLHIHGTDDGGWRFYLDPAITDFTYNGTSYSLQTLLSPSTDSYWYSSKNKWDAFNLYCESRGVSVVPEIEYLGHSSYICNKLPNIFGPIQENGGLVQLGKEITYIAFTKIINQLLITFPDTPFIYIGSDECVDEYLLGVNQDQNFFTLHPEVPKNNKDAIINFFMFRANNYIRNAGKRMIVWQNMNSYESYANTNNTIIAQVWGINGGTDATGAEDKVRTDIHGSSLRFISQGATVSQTPWWPRTFSPMINLFEWNPIVTPYVNPDLTNINDRSNPLPLNKVIGSTTLLWETHLHKLKLKYLQNKAPIRNENTYNVGRNSISSKTFSQTFTYLNNRFDTLLTGIRIVEKGLTKNTGDLMISNTGETQIPVCVFDKYVNIQLINNNANTTIRYIISNIISESEDTTFLDPLTSILYTSPINVSLYNPFILNGFFSLKYQLFNSSNEPISRLIEKYYLNTPFNITINGGYKFQRIELLPNLNNQNQFWFDGSLNIILNSTSIPGTVRFNFSRNKLDETSPVLTPGSKIVLRNTTDRIFIALFNESNLRIGGVWSGTFICNKDNYIPDSITNPPSNIYTVAAAQSLSIRKFYSTTTTNILISSLLPDTAPDTIKINVIVIGGGGGSASGGIATEVYYDIPISFLINIEVGLPSQKSSVSFNMLYPLSNDRDGTKAYQSLVYPTIAYQGIGSKQGLITRGDPTYSNYGYNYNGIPYGAPGYQGCVILEFST